MAGRARSRRKSGRKSGITPVLTRDISRPAERELWARAAGRCEFNGCNRLLYKSSVTQERVNISEKAHIYSFSEHGPRGRGGKSTRSTINDIGNLLLACHDCHRLIDSDTNGDKYSAALLQSWKSQHERRIEIVTGVDPSKKSHIVMYGARIGAEASKLHFTPAANALFPLWYPAEERPIELSMVSEAKDDSDDFWNAEDRNLIRSYERQLEPRLQSGEASHVSLFALAPMPLLIRLGSLITDKRAVDVYQLHREPQTWNWLTETEEVTFKVVPPESFEHNPALVISLSDTVAPQRIVDVLGKRISIWQVTIANPNNDFLRSRAQLGAFRSHMRQVIADIGLRHGKATPIAIFPAMPVACAIELGRIRMPKADPEWMVYDHNNKRGRFVHALSVRTPA